MEKVTGWPSIKAEDTKVLKTYGLFLRECSNAMDDLQYLEELNIKSKHKDSESEASVQTQRQVESKGM